jgi:hypothetical protein
MKNLKVTKIEDDIIYFDNGVELYSNHDSDCCESHELTLDDITISYFEGLEFDLSGDDFFKRVPDYGIELIPVNGHPVRIPAHGYNNGYYSDQLDLILQKGKEFTRTYDITECQDVSD